MTDPLPPVSETTRRLGPLRTVIKHRGINDRLECGHTVPAHGLVAERRRCKVCKSAAPLPPVRVADPERLLDLQAEEEKIDLMLLDEAEQES
jgi:hypothetical protein